MNCDRRFHASCLHIGDLFVCGRKDREPSTCCEMLSTADNNWKFIAEIKESGAVFQVVSCRKYMLAVGGYGLHGVLNTTEYYDDKWTKSTSMKEKKYWSSTVDFRDDVYVIGGRHDGDDDLSRSAEVTLWGTGWRGLIWAAIGCTWGVWTSSSRSN